MSHSVIIGGGIIGICCALQLQMRGHKVTVIDRVAAGESTMQASCGFIATSEVVPLSRPGALKKIPGFLTNPNGPLAIRPASFLTLFPWLLRFLNNARPQRIDHIAQHLTALTARSRADFDALLGQHHLQNLIRDKPIIEVYDSEAELAHERPYHNLRREQGFIIEEMSGAEAAEMEPALARDFAKAVVFSDWRSVVDTKRFATALYDVFTANGGTVLRDDVQAIHRDGSIVRGVQLQNGDVFNADQFVLAAGVWSKPLLAPLGISLPLAALGGYQTMLSADDYHMQHGVIYAAGGFGITPYEKGIGIAGTIEFAARDAQPNYQRARLLVEKARRVIPDLPTEKSVERFGQRPFCPDTLPIIDRAAGLSNLVLATGHGQLGVTLAATTGLLVSQMIAGGKTAVDIGAYRQNRF